MSEQPPYENFDYGFDFTIVAENDVERQCVLITDDYGFFCPVPFSQWERIVNNGYYPKLLKEMPYVHPTHVYYKAMQEYCKFFHYCYIGKN